MTTAIFLGDSITYGGGAIDAAHAYCYTTATRLGWMCVPMGLPSVGYIDNIGGGGPYLVKVPDVLAANPDVIVVQGSTNDWLHTNPDIAAAARLVYAAIRAARPTIPLYVMGVFLQVEFDTAIWSEWTQLMSAAAADYGAVFIDPRPWRTGSGTNAAPNGTGNADVYVDGSGIHPSQAGHDYLGTRLAFAIRPPSTGLVGL